MNRCMMVIDGVRVCVGKVPGAIAIRFTAVPFVYMADYLVQACSPMFSLPVSSMLRVSSKSGHVLELELLAFVQAPVDRWHSAATFSSAFLSIMATWQLECEANLSPMVLGQLGMGHGPKGSNKDKREISLLVSMCIILYLCISTCIVHKLCCTRFSSLADIQLDTAHGWITGCYQC